MRASVAQPPRVATNALESYVASRPADTRALWIAFGIALLIHMLVLLIQLPQTSSRATALPEHRNLIVVKKYVPPPPKLEARQQVVPRKKPARRIPVPDPTPDSPEPIREAAPEYDFVGPDSDADFLLGSPVPPTGSAPGGATPRAGPVLAGVGGVTRPVRIEDSYARPAYPELARRARIEGRVVLQAVIRGDGTVGEATVLSCSRTGVGFEQAAIDAVQRWRYHPATLDGEPIDVFFTIRVEFELT